MPENLPYINDQALFRQNSHIKGHLTEIDGEPVYCIQHYDLMKPFLMSVVSSGDLWMYVSSSGGLTAGRQHYNNALFPYDTDDKIHESIHSAGPKTIIRIDDGKKVSLWEPFSDRFDGLYRVRRNLYKNTPGSKIVFEEINETLQLVFRYSWSGSEALGWIRKSTLKNLSSRSLEASFCDGLINVLPWGITREGQAMMSTLMDAYKVCEYLPGSSMALYYMSSIPVDRAEPSEALRANTVWSFGLDIPAVLLSSRQLKNMWSGKELVHENKVFGQKTAYLLHAKQTLEAGKEKSWYIVADVAKDISGLRSLQHLIGGKKNTGAYIEKSIRENTRHLYTLVNVADGLQQSGDPLSDRRHFSNVLFNIMRGGVFTSDYDVDMKDFLKHLYDGNKAVYRFHKVFLSEQKEVVSLKDLVHLVRSRKDDDLLRLTLEYLPIAFSRRHGDPSRPWNYFDIRMKDSEGNPSLYYQGNWRDIFQNWQALGFSFPAFIPGMIARFLNASTADGYNPYRISRQGFDWEVPEPDNPWAYIGYWGDHQIIYLLRLMELQEKFFPGSLSAHFNKPVYAYACVPYRIKPYKEILQNPQDTIMFDHDLHDRLIRESHVKGNDGKLIHTKAGEIQKASFIEKILVSLLTKLSNFVPEAGIWLNTQRPEWNDANNALTGFGASMVTLYHIRPLIYFLLNITEESEHRHFALMGEVYRFYKDISDALNKHQDLLPGGFSGADRKKITDELGTAGERYRTAVYRGFSGQYKTLSKWDLLDFYCLVLDYVDQSVEKNRRADGLYHAYNMLEFKEDAIDIHHLYLMLEGQVAILDSGFLGPGRSLELLDAMFESELWREDQGSFMLYPNRTLPGFMEKNNIPKARAEDSRLFKALLEQGNKDIVVRDLDGQYHFNASLKNARILEDALQQLPPDVDPDLVAAETPAVKEMYEEVFAHRFFTGRSGSFYKYEGLGSIYWHMVSKLLLALGERVLEFSKIPENAPIIPLLKNHYYRIKAGIGMHKKPQEYGAFPTDPYSHTPLMMGVQQPGMTGQVKEDILSRFNELGLVVEQGAIQFNPALIREEDFDDQGLVTFTFCGTNVRIKKSNKHSLEIHRRDNPDPVRYDHTVLPADISGEIFDRRNAIERIVFNYKP